MRTITIGLLMLFAVALSGVEGFSWAQESPGSQMMGPGMMGPGHGMMGFPQASADRPLITFILEHKQELGLTTDQVGSLEAIRSDFQQEAAQRVGEIEAGEAELEGLVKQAPVDLKKVEATLRKIEAQRAALRLDRIKAIDRGRALLSTEQENKLQALLSQGEPRPWRRRG
jgi:Spy/CpxP family protein refolding chaperone